MKAVTECAFESPLTASTFYCIVAIASFIRGTKMHLLCEHAYHISGDPMPGLRHLELRSSVSHTCRLLLLGS